MREHAVFTQLLDKVVDLTFKEVVLGQQVWTSVQVTEFCAASAFITFECVGVSKTWVPLSNVLSIREVSEIEQRARAQEFERAI